LPVHALESRAALERLCRALGWTLPKPLIAKLDKLPPPGTLDAGAASARQAFEALGVALFKQTHSELAERCKGACPHMLTLNAFASIAALRSVGRLPPAAPGTPAGLPPAPVAAMAAAAISAAPATAPTAGTKPTVHLLHGGGLSLEIAEMVATRLGSIGATAQLANMTEVKSWAGEVRLLEAEGDLAPLHAVFLVETVSDGQPSENAGACTRFIHRKSHPAGALGRLRYAVLGLGDSNLLLDRQTTTAKDCNQAAQRLDGRLKELGATPFHARGEADDRTGNQEIAPWIDGLIGSL